jgi:nicotinate dehydrogenase subunit B
MRLRDASDHVRALVGLQKASSDLGPIIVNPSGGRYAFGELAAHPQMPATFDLTVNGRSVRVSADEQANLLGRNVARLDLPAKLAGAPFLQDLAPEGMLHARVLRQPRRGARLVGLDEAAVRRAGAVEMMREGDFVAFVAERESIARAALEVARQTAKWEGGVDAPDDAGTPQNLMALRAKDREIEVSARAAPAPARTVEALYSRPYLAHASLAPSCAVARFADGRLEVTTHAQGVYPLRIALAHALALDIERITVRHHQGAGCYGHNGADDVAFDAAAIAMRKPGVSVRVRWERDDEMAAAPFGAAMAVKIRAGLDAAGRPLDWTLEVFSPVHAQRPGMSRAPLLGREALPSPPPRPEPADPPDASGGGGTRNAAAIYQFPRQQVIHHFIPDPRVRTSALRSLGALPTCSRSRAFWTSWRSSLARTRSPIGWRYCRTRGRGG